MRLNERTAQTVVEEGCVLADQKEWRTGKGRKAEGGKCVCGESNTSVVCVSVCCEEVKEREKRL